MKKKRKVIIHSFVKIDGLENRISDEIRETAKANLALHYKPNQLSDSSPS